MTDLTRITTENNLGISGDAQTARELAIRGVNLALDQLEILHEAQVTIARLRKQRALSQNRTQDSEHAQVGTTGRLDVKTAQTGAEHSNERNE